ncbi:hypothetical protein LAB1_19930 [Roseibium sp. LAB1]
MRFVGQNTANRTRSQASETFFFTIIASLKPKINAQVYAAAETQTLQSGEKKKQPLMGYGRRIQKAAKGPALRRMEISCRKSLGPDR